MSIILIGLGNKGAEIHCTNNMIKCYSDIQFLKKYIILKHNGTKLGRITLAWLDTRVSLASNEEDPN